MSEYLPTDLILEIFSRLPSKSIARCRCLSKLWASLLTPDSPYFTELFLTQSKTRLRLIFTVQRKDHEWCLYSCPQPQISYENSEASLSVTAEFHMSLPNLWIYEMSPPISGLLYFPNVDNNRQILTNPSTRRFCWLPQPFTLVKNSFFGYDHIDKQFSVLAISHRSFHEGLVRLPTIYQILKLGTEKLSWRSLDCPLHHCPCRTSICINGILYYVARFGKECPFKIVCFDLNTEEFKFIDVPWSYFYKLLVNFKGKLGVIYTNGIGFCNERCDLELSLWVLEDVEKQEWSKHVCRFPPEKLWNTKLGDISIVGMTARGEIVLSLRYTTNPLYVYFFNLEKNILQKVEIKGLEGFKVGSLLYANVNYVEYLKDLNWN